QLIEYYPKITEKQLKEIKEFKDSILKRSETTCLRIQELLKPLSIYKKENYIVNLTLMEIDPNKVLNEIDMKTNLMLEEEILALGKQVVDIPNKILACQIRKNLSFYSKLTVKSFKANGKSKAAFIKIEFKNEKQEDFLVWKNNAHFEEIKHIKNPVGSLEKKVKIEIKSNEAHSKVSSLQNVLQINVLLQEILKRLETVESNQLVLLVTDKDNLSTRSLAYPRF
ncbi:38299_t:CDS:2, partial [Gigaspora margarita]